MVMAITRPVAVFARSVGATLGLESTVLFRHHEVHGTQHVRQHMVGFQLQVVGLQFQRYVAVGQVVGSTQQVARRAVLAARAHDQHRLRSGQHAKERAVLRQRRIATAQHRATGQHKADGAAEGVHHIETAFLAQVPRQFHGRGAAQQ